MDYDLVISISALQHFSYCPRQCALIHIEHVFDENVYTLRGRYGHERADAQGHSWGRQVRVERALPVWSDRLGLNGRADIVEFHPDGHVLPVEYKHGPRRASRHDDIQLCAQALCLEEMLQIEVSEGAIYSLTSHRRREVLFDGVLKTLTEDAIMSVRAMMNNSGPLPPPVADGRCPHCSLKDTCLPNEMIAGKRLQANLFTIGTEGKENLR